MNVQSLTEELGSSWVALDESFSRSGPAFIFRPELDSTWKEVQRWPSEAWMDPHPLLLVVDEQTQGVGRLKRRWSARKGASLTFNLVMPIERERSPGLWPLLVGWSQWRTYATWVGHRDLEIKWPNDILMGESKLSGILTAFFRSRGHSWLNLGLGVNVGPVEVEDGSSSSCLGEHLRREQVLEALVDAILEDARSLEEEDLLARVAQACPMCQGAEITWEEGGSVHSGSTCGLDPSGALWVRVGDGVRALSVSEVSRVRRERWSERSTPNG